ncbi:L,D-transpeptidase family protein [Polycladidibacter hongkongensis]|uniref:L,D-transpeptidase family protein n=1 Tax=Polycladidibacter hongkongensis TaxID=1647556 RepID=UPI000A729980|nr:L,D-transpeptidase family protein [Pseudovibrio hongkongensis]
MLFTRLLIAVSTSALMLSYACAGEVDGQGSVPSALVDPLDFGAGKRSKLADGKGAMPQGSNRIETLARPSALKKLQSSVPAALPVLERPVTDASTTPENANPRVAGDPAFTQENADHLEGEPNSPETPQEAEPETREAHREALPVHGEQPVAAKGVPEIVVPETDVPAAMISAPATQAPVAPSPIIEIAAPTTSLEAVKRTPDAVQLPEAAQYDESDVKDPRNEAIAAALAPARPQALARLTSERDSKKLRGALKSFYNAQDYTSLWFGSKAAAAKRAEALAFIGGAPAHGLLVADYLPETLPADETQAELVLSAALVKYSQHLVRGKLVPSKVQNEVHLKPKGLDPLALLQVVRSGGSISDYVLDQAALPRRYAALMAELARLRTLDVEDDVPMVTEGPSLKPGASGERLSQLQARLFALGYLAENELQETPHYDSSIEAAVRRFQQDNALLDDGIAGHNTITSLNRSQRDKEALLIANLERLRWENGKREARYVEVNIAEQVARIFEGGHAIYETRSVVGKPKHQTPVFSDEITYAEVNPYWHVPYSIAVNEYLPQLKADPNALAGTGIRVFYKGQEIEPTRIIWSTLPKRYFSFDLKQDPGHGNALGAVKFMFPNKHNIYLHDTPSKRLFARSSRAFSHGCIRLQDPFVFGEVLFGDGKMTQARFETLQFEGENRRYDLPQGVPVHLRYFTAFASESGRVIYRPDIYKQDAALLDALRKAWVENGETS